MSAWEGQENSKICVYIDNFDEYKPRFLSTLNPGDWLTMDFGVVDHHAIYAGDSHVYERNAENGREYKPLEWNWEWKVFKKPKDDEHRTNILHRAASSIDGKNDYNLVIKNCDSYCNYC